jgi:hypothetical protein
MLRPSNPIQVFSPYWYDIQGRRLSSSDPASLYLQVCEIDPAVSDYRTWHAVMIHRMCLELPKGSCIGDTDGAAYVKPLRWQDIVGFVNAVLSVVRSAVGGQAVYTDQHEADRRAFICSECPMNKHVTCAGCVGIIHLASKFLRARYAKGQTNLGACVVCGCWLPAKIWVHAEVLKQILKKQKLGDVKYPDNCWNKDLLT